MGQSPKANLFFGIVVEEDKLPWYNPETGHMPEPEEWYYRTVLGYKDAYEFWDGKGDYLPAYKNLPEKERHEAYRKWREPYNKFREANPIPFEGVYIGGYDCDCPYGIAVAGSIIGADWEHTDIEPRDLLPGPEGYIEFREFVKRFFPDISEDKIGWKLSAFYG